MESEVFKYVIGPLWSNYGLISWNLLLAEEKIVSWPYTSRENIKTGSAVGAGFISDPAERIKENLLNPSEEILLNRKLKTYKLCDVEIISLRNRMLTNTIEIQFNNGHRDRYHIYRRNETDQYQEILKSLYPTKYIEKGFPKSLLGRILKL